MGDSHDEINCNINSTYLIRLTWPLVWPVQTYIYTIKLDIGWIPFSVASGLDSSAVVDSLFSSAASSPFFSVVPFSCRKEFENKSHIC